MQKTQTARGMSRKLSIASLRLHTEQSVPYTTFGEENGQEETTFPMTETMCRARRFAGVFWKQTTKKHEYTYTHIIAKNCLCSDGSRRGKNRLTVFSMLPSNEPTNSWGPATATATVRTRRKGSDAGVDKR